MAAGVQSVLFFTNTGVRFVIYFPIRRYGDCNNFSSLYTLWLRLRVYLATSGVEISISTDRNVNNL